MGAPASDGVRGSAGTQSPGAKRENKARHLARPAGAERGNGGPRERRREGVRGDAVPRGKEREQGAPSGAPRRSGAGQWGPRPSTLLGAS